MIKKIVKTNPEVWPLSKMILEYKMQNLIISPEFQRDYVWNDKSMKDSLIRSMLLGYPIGVITIWRNSNGKNEVVDGLQRIKTIFDFTIGKIKIKLSKEISNEIIEAYYHIILQEADMGDINAKNILRNNKRNVTTLLTIDNITNSMKNSLDAYPLSLNVIGEASSDQIRSYFRVVQNQEKLKAGEIIKSIAENWINIELANYKINKNLSKILFNNSRNDFTKFLITFQGIIENKLKLGTSDKAVLSYAENISHNNLMGKAIKIILEALEKYDPTTNYTNRQFNKFSMKLLIGVSIWAPKFIEDDVLFMNLIQSIYWISDMISRENSLNSQRKKGIEQNPYYNHIMYLARLSRSVQSKNSIIKGIEFVVEITDNIDLVEVRRKLEKKFKKQPSQDLINRVYPRKK